MPEKISEIEITVLLNKISGKKIPSVKVDQYLIKDLGLASIELIDFIFELEKKYKVGIKISDFLKPDPQSSTVRKDFQVKEVIALVESKMM